MTSKRQKNNVAATSFQRPLPAGILWTLFYVFIINSS